jgi:hypothetical protein
MRTEKRPELTGGYCQYCNRLVARDSAACCSEAGHPPEGIYGLIDLQADGTLPISLPRFCWAAALMPPVWGVAHGVWSGFLLLPLWLFLDSALQSAAFRLPAQTPLAMRLITWAVSALLVVGTLALMYWFGRRGWGIAFRRRYSSGKDELPIPEFIRRERLWMLVSLPLMLAALALAVGWWLR